MPDTDVASKFVQRQTGIVAVTTGRGTGRLRAGRAPRSPGHRRHAGLGDGSPGPHWAP